MMLWQCFDDFVRKQRGTSEGVTLTLEARIEHIGFSHSILTAFNYKNCMEITREIYYDDVTSVKRI